MIHIIVTMTIKEGCMEEFLSLCGSLRQHVLAEAGCLRYDYFRELEAVLPIQEALDPNRITLVELWETREALKAHGQSQHMKDFGPRMKELRTGVVARVGESIF